MTNTYQKAWKKLYNKDYDFKTSQAKRLSNAQQMASIQV